MPGYVLGQSLTGVEGVPPWDGTGVPLPVGADGWPVLPDGGTTPLVITSPTDGATVEPLVDITGTGAGAGATVDLYVDSSPGAPVASVTADGDGAFTFTGATPLEVSPEGIQVGVGSRRSPKITVTVNLPAARADGDEGYDPSDHTVAEVQDYLADHPDQTDYVLDRERAGKARTTLIGA